MDTGIAADSFDREWTLPELLKGVNPARLEQILSVLLGPFRLLDSGGTPLLGSGAQTAAPARRELLYDMEAVGMLEADADERHMDAACALISQLLHSAARYLMASSLHAEAIQADYEALQQKHSALAESEVRYRALSATLEQRVAEQVAVIEDAQRKLYQAEKLASVGQLAAGVAHEINTPIGFMQSNLTTAIGYCDALGEFAARMKQDAADPARAWDEAGLDEVVEDFPDLLGETLEGTRRIGAIVKDLKTFSRVDTGGREPADISELLASVVNIAAGRITDRAEIILDTANLPRVTCDAAAMGQVFMNLLLNAVEALDGPGTVRLSTRLDGDWLCLKVHDTGRGIPEAIRGRIFDPFFTTKDVGQGSGLGLTVCHDVIKAHGGHIDVASRPGGTTVTVSLPARGTHG